MCVYVLGGRGGERGCRPIHPGRRHTNPLMCSTPSPLLQPLADWQGQIPVMPDIQRAPFPAQPTDASMPTYTAPNTSAAAAGRGIVGVGLGGGVQEVGGAGGAGGAGPGQAGGGGVNPPPVMSEEEYQARVLKSQGFVNLRSTGSICRLFLRILARIGSVA